MEKREEWLVRMRDKKVFVLDLDGVLYLNDTMIPYADAAVDRIRKKGYRVAFLTNNSGKHKRAVYEKLNRLGISCSLDEVYTSLDSAIYYIKAQGLADGVFAIGTEDMRVQLQEEQVSLASPDQCKCILVGFKKSLNYDDATQAIIALRRDVPFIICNRDPFFPDINGVLMPGCGYTVCAIEGCYTRKADVNAGKPNPRILDVIYQAYGVGAEDMVVVGDSLHSDIGMANRAGIPSVYVGKEPCDEVDAVCASDIYEFVKQYL